MPEDLSLEHRQVSEMFTLPKTSQQWDEFRLSEEQLEFYRENGYLGGLRILSDDQVEKLRKELSGLFDPNHPGNQYWYEYCTNESTDPETVLFHALGARRIKPGFHDLLWNPAFTMPASQLLGGAVRFWHDQLFCKPPKHGGVVAWHQDYSYWTRTVPMNHLTLWIGLDDSTKANGCVHYIPGSHRWDLLPITGLAGDVDAIKKALTEEQWEKFQKPVAVELKKGEAVFHHPLTVHGSFENRTIIPRRAAVINVFLDGTRSASDEPLLPGIPSVPFGNKVTGRFFPLLFNPEEQ